MNTIFIKLTIGIGSLERKAVKKWSCNGRDRNNNLTTAYTVADDWYRAKADFESRLTDVINIKEVKQGGSAGSSLAGGGAFTQLLLVTALVAFFPFIIIVGGINLLIFVAVKSWLHSFFIIVLLIVANVLIYKAGRWFFDHSNQNNAKLFGALLYGITFLLIAWYIPELDFIWTTVITTAAAIGGWFLFGFIWSSISRQRQGSIINEIDFVDKAKAILTTQTKG